MKVGCGQWSADYRKYSSERGPSVMNERRLVTLFYIIIHLSEVSCDAQDNKKCVHIDYRGRPQGDENTCQRNPICRKTFQISVVNMPPYSEYPIGMILRKCCGNCTSIRKANHFSNITEVTPFSIQSSDFLLLLLGTSTAETLYGYHFIPVIYAPSVIYITKKNEPVLTRLVNSCLKLYPLIVVCLLLAVIAGFIAWLMETWGNEEEFPRPFFRGWFEGFWWGFVSMTTVGYGDKIPRSIHARLFSIIWILIGVAMFGIFTAMLTTNIMEASKPAIPHISGSKVGVLKYREYDASVVAKSGGRLIETDSWDFESDILQLIYMLRSKQIDGILLDKYTLRYAQGHLMNVSGTEKYIDVRDDINFFVKDTLRTEEKSDEKFSYGILVKSAEDYQYFRSAIMDNRLPLETEISLDYNNEERETDSSLFSPGGSYFIGTLKITFGIVGIIFIFGVIFEVRRRSIISYEAPACVCSARSCAVFRDKSQLV